MEPKTNYSILELKQILIDISEHGPDSLVRFRLLGELWQTRFVRIISLNDGRLLIHDEAVNKLISLDVNQIMQFELDHKFKGIDPHFHYDVVLEH